MILLFIINIMQYFPIVQCQIPATLLFYLWSCVHTACAGHNAHSLLLNMAALQHFVLEKKLLPYPRPCNRQHCLDTCDLQISQLLTVCEFELLKVKVVTMRLCVSNR